MNAMNGPYLSITWKPKNFFSEPLRLTNEGSIVYAVLKTREMDRCSF